MLSFEISLSKNQIEEFTQYLEHDLSALLNHVKSIIIWDNVFTSSMVKIYYFNTQKDGFYNRDNSICNFY